MGGGPGGYRGQTESSLALDRKGAGGKETDFLCGAKSIFRL